MVSSVGLAICALATSSDIGVFAAQSTIFYRYYSMNILLLNSHGDEDEKHAYEP